MSDKIKVFLVMMVVSLGLGAMLLYTFRKTDVGFEPPAVEQTPAKPLVYNQISSYSSIRKTPFPPLAASSFASISPYVTKFPSFRTQKNESSVTEVYETTSAFDSYRFEYYSLTAESQYPPGKDSPAVKAMTLAAYFVDAQNEKRMAYTTFFMDKAAPEKCFVHSFLKESRFLFLSCPDDLLLLGFLFADADSPNREDQMSHVFAQNAEPRLSITLVAPYKFYLPVGSALWILESKEDSFVMERSVSLGAIAPLQTKTSPKGHYYFLADSGLGGVVDTKRDRLVPVDSSCFAKTPKSEDNRFFNDTVDMFVGGPYKTVSVLSWSADEREAKFEQTYCSGGGCAREGTGTLTIGDDKVVCDILVKYEHLDEYD